LQGRRLRDVGARRQLRPVDPFPRRCGSIPIAILGRNIDACAFSSAAAMPDVPETRECDLPHDTGTSPHYLRIPADGCSDLAHAGSCVTALPMAKYPTESGIRFLPQREKMALYGRHVISVATPYKGADMTRHSTKGGKARTAQGGKPKRGI